MARLLSDECLSLARLIASGVPCSEIYRDDGRNIEDVLKDIAIELLLLDASHEEKSYVISDVRKSHKNAYKPWSSSEEKILMGLLIEGRTIGDISEHLGRQPGGVISRIKKIKSSNSEKQNDT